MLWLLSTLGKFGKSEITFVTTLKLQFGKKLAIAGILNNNPAQLHAS